MIINSKAMEYQKGGRNRVIQQRVKYLHEENTVFVMEFLFGEIVYVDCNGVESFRRYRILFDCQYERPVTKYEDDE